MRELADRNISDFYSELRKLRVKYGFARSLTIIMDMEHTQLAHGVSLIDGAINDILSFSDFAKDYMVDYDSAEKAKVISNDLRDIIQKIIELDKASR